MNGLQEKPGFTIIEMITVIVLLSLLTAFAIPNYTKAVVKSKERQAITGLKAIHAANALRKVHGNGYFNAVKNYPNSINTINNNLSLNLAEKNGIQYYYSGTAGGYTAQARWNNANGVAMGIVQITPAKIDNTDNPCCASGTCYSVPNC